MLSGKNRPKTGPQHWFCSIDLLQNESEKRDAEAKTPKQIPKVLRQLQKHL